jgi:hypothetical protein
MRVCALHEQGQVSARKRVDMTQEEELVPVDVETIDEK